MRRARRDPPRPQPPEAAAAPGAARALWAGLVVLAAARAALASVPSMWAWGLNTLRFVEPAAGWSLWALAAAGLVPGVGRRLTAWAARAGDAAGRAPWVSAAAAAALVWLLPDRVRFVGDALLRQGTLEVGARPETLLPQALPLERLLHYAWPLAFARLTGLDPALATRLLGALDAAALALLAIAFARALDLRGAPAAAAAAVVFFGGSLGLLAGYGKAFAELSVLTTAVGTFAVRVARRGDAVLPLGIALAASFALHRSGLVLLPVALAAWVVGLRRHGEDRAWLRPGPVAGAAIPLAALALLLPRMVETVAGLDFTFHLAATPVRGSGAAWSAATAPVRLADLVNVVALLSPLALAAPAVAVALGRRAARLPEAAPLAALALPCAALLAGVLPRQGIPRDWDVYAAAGAAASLLAAWLAGGALRAAPRHAWLAAAIVLGAAAPPLQWLLHQADVERGLERARALATEPPPRSDAARAATWDYLGIRNLRLGRWDAARAALREAAALSPSPRVLMQWGYAEAQAGDLAAAQRVYRQWTERAPDDREAWKRLARTSARRGDAGEARRAAGEILRRDPGNAEARRLLEALEGEGAAGPAP